ncbi:DNA primase large subunit Spp2 [Cladophialophora chaetospira]|uniref:Pre-mRNA-splicing factor n=1 Tax=Cladophialophora chaetospira TaxID=386627 RepID=A0AA38X3V3_9EURO|nr:DNA primase large subunit Spp2 [Cladophialophora chaetospira]
MSKPISFGFGKSKPAGPAAGAGSLPSRKPAPSKAPSRTALRHDSDNEDEEEPKHESVTGFSSTGAILSRPVQESKELVIENSGNGDWRRRGRTNLLPAEVQAAQRGDGPVMVEKDEVSKASGLQFADKAMPEPERTTNGTHTHDQVNGEAKPLTADEEALQALLDDGSGKPRSNAVIELQGNKMLAPRDEEQDFREDIATRPESSTLEEYAAMPVEEFGMAMLRGMGKKRRANGEVIDLTPQTEDSARKQRKNEGFLGIGAKAAPGTNGVELGAWGKADMRKNNKGEGFFTPLMRENKVTGERIPEEEFQKKLKESKGGKDEDDWRQRRDRNLEKSGRDRDRNGQANGDDGYRDQMNSFSRSSSSKRDRDDEYESSRSKRHKDDGSRSRRDDDRERDGKRRRKDDSSDHDSRHKDKYRDRHRDDDDRYESSSSHRSARDRDRDRDRDSNSNRAKYTDRDRDSDRRHRDR